MKHALLVLAGLLVCGAHVNAGYDHRIETGYSGGLTLEDSESLLMTGGGLHDLTLFDDSKAEINNTDQLKEHEGGIWRLALAGSSELLLSGGGVHQLDLNSGATAVVSGGRIDEIWSYQQAWVLGGDPPSPVPYPHITFICETDSVLHDTQTNILTGDWLGGTGFEIQLVDVDGYSPVFENIQFIPEPATLLLMGAATLFIRKRP